MKGIPFDSSRGPSRCCAFLIDGQSGAPLGGVPVFAEVEFTFTPADAGANAPAASTDSVTGGSAYSTAVAPSRTGKRPFGLRAGEQILEVMAAADLNAMGRIPLGLLASDHAGYLSWDLEPLRRRLLTLVGLNDAIRLNSQITAIWLHLYGPLQSVVNALDGADLSPDALVVRLAVDPGGVYIQQPSGFPSMQSPSLVDWYLSAGSFAYIPAEIIGADGCDSMLPSNIATQRFKAYQSLKTSQKFALTFLEQDPGDLGLLDPASRPKRVLIGAPQCTVALLLTYNITWLPVGHGLGQVLYSLPLAPCEQVNIAVIDWARTDTAARQEETGLTDTLTHDTLRDRTVGEVVDASMREYQRGSSTMAGGSVVGGAAGIVGGALSLGTSYSTSSGERSMSANTSQTLVDHFHQASAAIRDLRSTVVVHSTQQVSQNLQTRTVRNHNHAHALTVLYYEVLRHYRVVVEMSDRGPALLVPQTLDAFDADHADQLIFQYRRFLEAALLIEELRPGFDAIEKLFALSPPWETPIPPTPPGPDPGDITFELYDFTFKVPDNGQSGWLEVKGQLIRKDGVSIPLRGAAGSDVLAVHDNFKNTGYIVPGQGIPSGDTPKWKDLQYIKLDFHAGDHDVTVIVGAAATDTNAQPHPIFQDWNVTWIPTQQADSKLIVIPEPPPVPIPPPPPTPLDRLSPDERSFRARLISHLNENLHYYWRQIWMGEDPNARLDRLADRVIDVGGNKVPLFDAVENRVVDVIGTSLVFPLADDYVKNVTFPTVEAARSEALISLPTRGVFGEAKLGHCNSAEIIDNTRFWDWTMSPCPDQAPAITGVSPQGLGTPNVPTPTPLPASNLSIATPPSEPDPIGLRAALDVLKTPGIFNNMSGIQQLQGLVSSLSDAAAKVATAKKPDQPADPGATGQTQAPKASGATAGGGTTPPATGTSAGTPADQPAVDDGTTGTSDLTTPTTEPGGDTSVPPSPTPQPVSPPKPTPAPPRAVTPMGRMFQFYFAPVKAGVLGSAMLDNGQYSIGIVQSQKILNQPVATVPAAAGIRVAADLDSIPTPPATIKISVNIVGSCSYSYWARDAKSGLLLPVTSAPSDLSGQQTFEIDPKLAEFTFQVKRQTATKSVQMKAEEASATNSSDVAAAKLGIGFEKWVSVSGEGSDTVTKGSSSTITTGSMVTWEVTYYTGILEITSGANKAT